VKWQLRFPLLGIFKKINVEFPESEGLSQLMDVRE
jgi:hypothetical protein